MQTQCALYQDKHCIDNQAILIPTYLTPPRLNRPPPSSLSCASPTYGSLCSTCPHRGTKYYIITATAASSPNPRDRAEGGGTPPHLDLFGLLAVSPAAPEGNRVRGDCQQTILPHLLPAIQSTESKDTIRHLDPSQATGPLRPSQST